MPRRSPGGGWGLGARSRRGRGSSPPSELREPRGGSAGAAPISSPRAGALAEPRHVWKCQNTCAPAGLREWGAGGGGGCSRCRRQARPRPGRGCGHRAPGRAWSEPRPTPGEGHGQRGDVRVCGGSRQAKPILGRSGPQFLEIRSPDAAPVVVQPQRARPSLLRPPPQAPCVWSPGLRAAPGRHSLRLLHPTQSRCHRNCRAPCAPSPGQEEQRMSRHPTLAAWVICFSPSPSGTSQLFPPSSHFSCVSTSFFPVCCHWLSFFIFPSFLVW